MPLVIFYCQGKCLFIPVVYVSFGLEFVHIEVTYQDCKSLFILKLLIKIANHDEK